MASQLTKAQLWAVNQEGLFGYDAKGLPVIKGTMMAINAKGHTILPTPPVAALRKPEAAVKLVAVVQIEFDATAEATEPDELVSRLQEDSDLRNRIARKLETIVRFADSFVDKQVGWIDEDRSIHLSEHLGKVRVRGIARVRDEK